MRGESVDERLVRRGELLLSLEFLQRYAEITGELQKKVEKGFIDWCVEVGVPLEKLEDRRRFWTFLKWVAEKPDVREKLVKTGWKSWNTKWRDKIFKTKRKF